MCVIGEVWVAGGGSEMCVIGEVWVAAGPWVVEDP